MKDNIRYNKLREYLEPLNNNDIFSRLAKNSKGYSDYFKKG